MYMLTLSVRYPNVNTLIFIVFFKTVENLWSYIVFLPFDLCHYVTLQLSYFRQKKLIYYTERFLTCMHSLKSAVSLAVVYYITFVALQTVVV